MSCFSGITHWFFFAAGCGTTLEASQYNADAQTPRKADKEPREDDTVTYWKKGQLVSLQDKDGDAFAHAVV